MNQGKYIFVPLIEFLPRRVFNRIVKKYNGNKYVRSFTCWDQMLCMVFGQLTSRDSIRDLIFSWEAVEIAMLYKKCWEVELFLKWMKQHLRIRSFWGDDIECGKGPNLLCNHSLLSGSHRW